MSDLVAVAFKNEHQAEKVRTELMAMQEGFLVDLEDAVVAVRKDNGEVKLRQMYNLTASGALSGGFWGMLVGLIFLSPLLGFAIGGVAGAAAGALSDVGINDDFMKQLGSALQPGGSALFVLVRHATTDKVLEQLGQFTDDATILHTSLSHEDEEKLRSIMQEREAEAIGRS